jgi:KDO2-lipid IV(A) lauroyltransferase
MINISCSPEKIKNYVAHLKISLGGKILYYLLPYRKKIVLNNMQHVFQNVLSTEEIKKLAQGFYSHLAKLIRENIGMFFLPQRHLKKNIEINNLEILFSALEKNKGLIILSGHFGSWEYAFVAFMLSCVELKNRVFCIRKEIKNKFLQYLAFRQPKQAGIHIIPKNNGFLKAFQQIRKKNIIVFVMDQHASSAKKEGIRVPFFNKEAGTYAGLAQLAKRTGAVVLPQTFYRDNNGKHILRVYPEIPWQKHDDPEQELYINTQAYNKALEDIILEHPDQWLWLHKRWKKK